MSQQWEHQCVQVHIGPTERGLPEDSVNAVLADWSAQGWEAGEWSRRQSLGHLSLFRRAESMG